ncbi:MAG: hypothetical protein ABIJ97_15545 [Bacteroidota bacterium]
MTFKCISFFIIIVFLSTQACRKGEDDPLISLRSRNSRLAGKWELKYLNGYVNFYNDKDEKLFWCQCIVDYELFSSMRYSKGNEDYGWYYLYEDYTSYFIFYKEGQTYSRIYSKDHTYISEGSWAWENEIGKNMEYIYISDLNIILEDPVYDASNIADALYMPVYFEDFKNINYFKIKKLSNDELVLCLIDEILINRDGNTQKVKLIFDMNFEKNKDFKF